MLVAPCCRYHHLDAPAVAHLRLTKNLCQFDTVHLRHLQVYNQQVVILLTHHFYKVFGLGAGVAFHTVRMKYVPHHLKATLRIVNGKYAPHFLFVLDFLLSLFVVRLSHFLNRDGYKERAALTVAAADFDMAVHQFDKLRHDGKSKPYAVLSECLGFSQLLERLEDFLLLLLGYTDAGIADFHRETALFIGHIQADTAGIREFHGIGKQITANLVQFAFIAHQGKILTFVCLELQVLLSSLQSIRCREAVNQCLQVEGLLCYVRFGTLNGEVFQQTAYQQVHLLCRLVYLIEIAAVLLVKQCRFLHQA